MVIRDSTNLVQLEDLYLPYKKKRKTKADAAREKGLEPLAKILMAQNISDFKSAAKKFVQKDIFSVEEAIQGAQDIAAEWINENGDVRKRLRRLYQDSATISAKVIKKKEGEEAAQKFKTYFDWQEQLKKIPSHRLLAILRAETEGFIRMKIEVEKEQSLRIIERQVVKDPRNSCTPYVKEASEDAFKRLLDPALSKEVLSTAKEKADVEAIKVFADNLKQLLLAPPLGQKRILALDPGFKSGCKLVCLDESGELQHNETIFPKDLRK